MGDLMERKHYGGATGRKRAEQEARKQQLANRIGPKHAPNPPARVTPPTPMPIVAPLPVPYTPPVLSPEAPPAVVYASMWKRRLPWVVIAGSVAAAVGAAIALLN